MAGATIGGIGGGAFGLGVGGMPGAMGGAALGGGAGESARQLVQRWRGKEAPGTAGEAASAIGGEAATQGAMEGLGGSAIIGGARLVRGMRPYIKPVAKAVAENIPFVGPAGKRAIDAVRETRFDRLIADTIDSPENVAKGARAVFEHGAKNNAMLSADDLADVLGQLQQPDRVRKIGGVTKTLSGKGPTINPEVSGGMITTQPDKWGMSSIRSRADEALSYPRSDTASAFTMAKRAEGAAPVATTADPLAWGNMVDTGTGSTMPAAQAARQGLTSTPHSTAGALDIRALRDAAQARHDALFQKATGSWNMGGGPTLTASERALLAELKQGMPLRMTR
jgi:hypothetical protein